jgi:type I restriction enzyme S subunit
VNWITAPLAKVSKVFDDGDWIESKDQSEDGIRLVQTGNVGEGVFKDRRDKARFISEATFKRLNCSEVQPGDILISRLPDPVGRACVVPDTGDKMITAVDCTIVRPDDDRIDPSFLIYYSQTANYLRDIEQRCTGTTRKRISRKSLGQISIPLPPLDEQKRIVAVLDQAFAALDRARALAEANLADADSLLTQTVEAALYALGEPQPIGRHVELLSGFAFKSGGYTDDPEDVRLIRGDNIVQGAFRWDGVKRWPKRERSVYARYELAADDVLIAMDRTWVSAGIKYAVVDEEALPSLLVQRVARLRTKSTVLSSFLAFCIGSKLFERYVLDIQTGLGVPHVSGKQLEAFEVPVPDLEAQRDFVERIEAIRGRSKALTANLRTSLLDIADLRQSLLQKAFAGELT